MTRTMVDVMQHDRPREKLQSRGVAALGDNELLAVLIGHGTRGRSALALANDVLALAGHAHGLPRLRREQLARVPGVGLAQASRIIAAVELGRRTLVPHGRTRPLFRTPRELAQTLLPQFGGFAVERFGVVLLDARFRWLATRLISMGSVDSTPADPRDVFREALMADASSVVIFHNHPSGDPTPSPEDLVLTRAVQHAGTIVGVPLVDHIILGDTGYCSLKEAKIL